MARLCTLFVTNMSEHDDKLSWELEVDLRIAIAMTIQLLMTWSRILWAIESVASTTPATGAVGGGAFASVCLDRSSLLTVLFRNPLMREDYVFQERERWVTHLCKRVSGSSGHLATRTFTTAWFSLCVCLPIPSWSLTLTMNFDRVGVFLGICKLVGRWRLSWRVVELPGFMHLGHLAALWSLRRYMSGITGIGLSDIRWVSRQPGQFA